MDTRMLLVAAVLAAGAAWCWLPPADARLAADRPRRTPPVPAALRPVEGAPGRAVRAATGLVTATAVLALVPGHMAVLAALVAGLVVHVGLGRVTTGGSRRAEARVVLELPETFDLLAAALEAGQPLRSAVSTVAGLAPPATAPTLQRIAAMVGVGIADADAWRSFADDPWWGDAARDLARSCETGTPAAALLRQLADDARTRRRDELLKRARAVGVRSVLPLSCCFLPAFLLTGVVPIVAGLVGSLLHR